MLHAVIVRTLRPGVTYEQCRDAWMPERVEGRYPARTSVGRNVSNDRQVITILELDVPTDEFAARRRSKQDDRTDHGATVAVVTPFRAG